MESPKTPLALGPLLALFLYEPCVGQSRHSQGGSQEATVRFGVEVDYVEVNAVVSDADGNFVSGLGLEDFAVYEDGKPQEIASLAAVNIPVERPRDSPFLDVVEPDVRSNTQVSAGRVYVVVLDDYHTEARRTGRVQRAAREFIEQRLGANDIAAVVHTSGRQGAFSSSKNLLLAAVDRFVGCKLRSATVERLDQLQALPAPKGVPREIEDRWESERALRARSTLEIIENLSERLADVHGRRKAIVYFGEGIDYDIHDVFEAGEAMAIMDSTERAIGEATRANVAVYTIDPRGLVLAGEGAATIGNVPIDSADQIGGPSIISALRQELRVSQDSLRVLSEETGGFAVLNQNDWAPGLTRIVDENSHYYLLGYYPTNSNRDGKYRKIEVRVDRPSVEVRARRGYVAPREGDKREVVGVDVPDGASAELDRLFQSPLPVPGIAMHATACSFRIGRDRAVVPLVVELNIDRFGFEEREGNLHDDVEFAAVAVDYTGRAIAGVRRHFQLSLRPITYRRMTQAGLRVMTALELPPGRYQLRIVASEAGAGQGGSLFHDIEIPEYGSSDLVMTPLVVSSMVESGVPIFGTTEDKRRAALLPATRRTFARQDRLMVLAEIYPRVPSGSRPPTVEVTTTIKATEEQAVFTDTEERPGRELAGPGEGISHRAEIPLADLAPGHYLLEVKARDTSEDVEVIRRVLIEIF